MNLLTFDNPVFRYYAVAAALMIVKMMSQGWITIFRMIKVQGGYRYPEDAQRSPANPHPSPEQLLRTICRAFPTHARKRRREYSTFPRRGAAIRLHRAKQRHCSLCFHHLRTFPFCPFLCRADGVAARGTRPVLDGRFSRHLFHGRGGALDCVEALMELVQFRLWPFSSFATCPRFWSLLGQQQTLIRTSA